MREEGRDGVVISMTYSLGCAYGSVSSGGISRGVPGTVEEARFPATALADVDPPPPAQRLEATIRRASRTTCGYQMDDAA